METTNQEIDKNRRKVRRRVIWVLTAFLGIIVARIAGPVDIGDNQMAAIMAVAPSISTIIGAWVIGDSYLDKGKDK